MSLIGMSHRSNLREVVKHRDLSFKLFRGMSPQGLMGLAKDEQFQDIYEVLKLYVYEGNNSQRMIMSLFQGEADFNGSEYPQANINFLLRAEGSFVEVMGVLESSKLGDPISVNASDEYILKEKVLENSQD